MKDRILKVQGPEITEISRTSWEKHLAQVPQLGLNRLRFMSEAHHRVRNFVVSELPRIARPLSPEFIAQNLALPLKQVNTILVELEKNLFFLVRNNQGAVSWAYPVTVEETPHQVVFKSGEQLYGA